MKDEFIGNELQFSSFNLTIAKNSIMRVKNKFKMILLD